MKATCIKLLLIALLLYGINTKLKAQIWSKSFTAGNFDLNNKFLGGSEVLQLISHKKKLFASVGYWKDGNNIWYGVGFGVGVGVGVSFGIGIGVRVRDVAGQGF